MAADRFDVLAVIEYTDKTTGQPKSSFKKIGTAFRTKTGGFSVNLFAFPVNGKCLISEERQEGKGGYRGSKGGYGNKQQAPQQNQDAEPPQDDEPPM